MLQGKNGFYQGCQTRRSLGMAHIRLDRPDVHAVISNHSSNGFGLERISHSCSSTMTFHETRL